MLLIPSALIASNAHYVGWYNSPGSTVHTRYDSWQEQFLGYAFALAALVVIVFTIIEVIIDPTLNVWPMVPAGNTLDDMIMDC